jgi:hypothetical protein
MMEEVSSHTKESVGVHASAIEARIDDIRERQTREQGPKSSAMLEIEVFSLGGSAHGAKRPDTSTEGSSLSSSTCFKCVAPHDCNTPGVDHQLSSGFKLKHDKLVEMTMPKSNLWR